LRNFAEVPLRLDLNLGGEHRAADEPRKVCTVGDHRIKLVEIGLNGVDGFFVARQFKQGRRITACYARDVRIIICHESAL
jgi:hypothetical protein